jgi:hypothetical protein
MALDDDVWVVPPEDQSALSDFPKVIESAEATPSGKTSPKGAKGVMQVEPYTMSDPGFGVRPAADGSPEEIDRVGVDYAKAMLGRYGSQRLAAAAYNAGPGKLDEWLNKIGDPRKGEISEDEFVKQIPFPETNAYVQRVAKLSAPKDDQGWAVPSEDQAVLNADQWQVPEADKVAMAAAQTSYDTPLKPDEETAFQAWKKQYAPKDSGADYDLRGAFKAGLKPDPQTGHWPDTFKKPNHPTFSDESIYAKNRPDLAGHWTGPHHDQYVPPVAGQQTPRQPSFFERVVQGTLAQEAPPMPAQHEDPNHPGVLSSLVQGAFRGAINSGTDIAKQTFHDDADTQKIIDVNAIAKHLEGQMSPLLDEINTLNPQIKTLAGQLDALKAQAQTGDPNAIAALNAGIEQYNALLQQQKPLVDQYNALREQHEGLGALLPQDNTPIGKLLAEPWSKGLADPSWYAAQFAYGAASSWPALTFGAIGTFIGGGPEEPAGIATGIAGFGVGSLVQELGPAYQRARQAGLTHEDAVDRAMIESGISGVIGTMQAALPGAKVFGKTAEGQAKHAISEALLQVFGLQPIAGTAGAELQAKVEGRDLTGEEAAQSFATQAGVGAALVGTHAALRAVGAPAEAPRAEVPPPPEEPVEAAPASEPPPVPPTEGLGAYKGRKGKPTAPEARGTAEAEPAAPAPKEPPAAPTVAPGEAQDEKPTEKRPAPDADAAITFADMYPGYKWGAVSERERQDFFRGWEDQKAGRPAPEGPLQGNDYATGYEKRRYAEANGKLEPAATREPEAPPAEEAKPELPALPMHGIRPSSRRAGPLKSWVSPREVKSLASSCRRSTLHLMRARKRVRASSRS